jgi:hypothetical protein
MHNYKFSLQKFIIGNFIILCRIKTYFHIIYIYITCLILIFFIDNFFFFIETTYFNKNPCKHEVKYKLSQFNKHARDDLQYVDILSSGWKEAISRSSMRLTRSREMIRPLKADKRDVVAAPGAPLRPCRR